MCHLCNALPLPCHTPYTPCQAKINVGNLRECDAPGCTGTTNASHTRKRPQTCQGSDCALACAAMSMSATPSISYRRSAS